MRGHVSSVLGISREIQPGTRLTHTMICQKPAAFREQNQDLTILFPCYTNTVLTKDGHMNSSTRTNWLISAWWRLYDVTYEHTEVRAPVGILNHYNCGCVAHALLLYRVLYRSQWPSFQSFFCPKRGRHKWVCCWDDCYSTGLDVIAGWYIFLPSVPYISSLSLQDYKTNTITAV